MLQRSSTETEKETAGKEKGKAKKAAGSGTSI
jgi:hypothetical protein